MMPAPADPSQVQFHLARIPNDHAVACTGGQTDLTRAQNLFDYSGCSISPTSPIRSRTENRQNPAVTNHSCTQTKTSLFPLDVEQQKTFFLLSLLVCLPNRNQFVSFVWLLAIQSKLHFRPWPPRLSPASSGSATLFLATPIAHALTRWPSLLRWPRHLATSALR